MYVYKQQTAFALQAPERQAAAIKRAAAEVYMYICVCA